MHMTIGAQTELLPIQWWGGEGVLSNLGIHSASIHPFASCLHPELFWNTCRKARKLHYILEYHQVLWQNWSLGRPPGCMPLRSEA